MSKDLKQKKLLITGGANGLGREIVYYFAPLLKETIFIDVKKNDGKSLEKKLIKNGCNVKFYSCDLSNLSYSQKLFDKIFIKHPNINFLINNVRNKNNNSFKNENHNTWHKTLNIILNSSFLLIQKFINQKKNKNLRSIINITSILVDLIDHKSPSYHVAKTGLSKLTEYYAVHAAKDYNFRINNISPGHLVQKRHLKKFNHKNNINFKKKYLSSVPLNQHMTEDDVISTIEFLFSKKSNFYNGETFHIDGAASLMTSTMFLKQ